MNSDNLLKNQLKNQLSDESNAENGIQPNSLSKSRPRQLLWFVGLWIVGVLAMGAIAAVFKFFVQFAYD